VTAGPTGSAPVRRCTGSCSTRPSKWVFASLYTQPLEIAPVRTLIRDLLALPGNPQMLLQLGLAHTTHATARRPPDELIDL
jgi:hypothetical protein